MAKKSFAVFMNVALFLTFVATAGALRSLAQEKKDPRVGLKAGLHDAGEAARNMEKVASLNKPEGFFDPLMPGGGPVPPEPDPNAPPPDPNAPPDPKMMGIFANMIGFANSDLAFSGTHAFQGNFHGFTTYDVENARKPKLVGSVACPGGQGDVSVRGHLLFMSVEETRGRVDCGTQGIQEKVSGDRFRGVRIFDITDLAKPRQIAAVQTCRGSHTHTLVPDPKDQDNIYVYGSGTSSVRSVEELAGCSGLKPDEDPNTSLFSIDVIKVPLAHPEQAAVVNRPRVFADIATGAVNGLWAGGDHGPGTQKTSVTNQCHDITVFPDVGLAAGACSGNGILLDIHDPVHPVRLDHVVDKNFAYWHSATFNNDGTKVVFTDEWGGGLRPRCRASDPLTWGADAIFDIVDQKMQFRGYYKMPAAQTEQENCVAHNGSLIPVPGRDIIVQGWYQGGVSAFDFTDSTHPFEIAFFDRGPVDAKQLMLAGFWAAYWYNGFIYGSEIARGLDIFRLTPSDLLSQNEIDAALLMRADEFNPQMQMHFYYPDGATVAKAYVDQLVRSRAMSTDHAKALDATLDQITKLGPGSKDRQAPLDRVQKAMEELERALPSANSLDAKRMRSLSLMLRRLLLKLR
ncbi:MAG TPA: hypothetical protein VGY57_01105 [Vicinamibacterales bacterium]|nr:hypothetical protein [Vicinamibacterales bacterium]